MALTDHNTIKGYRQLQKKVSKDFLVLPGLEISTADGHLLAYNVMEEIPPNRSIEETIERVNDCGGIPVVPHLFRLLSGVKKEKLNEVHTKIPAVEVFNGCSMPTTNLKTAKTAHELGLGGIGGSVLVHDDALGVDESEVFAPFVQGEIGVGISLLIDVVVHGLPRREDDQVSAGRQQRLGREGPLPQIAALIGQAPARERDRPAAVVQLDPIGGVPLAIDQASSTRSPLRPPCFSISRMSVMRARRSIPLTMS